MAQVSIDATNWADIKDVSELRRADRLAVNQAVTYEVDGESKLAVVRESMADDVADAVLKTVVTNWSLPFPLPSADPSSLGKLTLEQDDRLREAIQPHIDALRGNKTPVKANEGPTPGSVS